MKHLAWTICLILAACSPYNYQKEVSAFSTGVDQLSDGFVSGYANLAADRATQTQLVLTTSREKVAVAASCGLPVGDMPQSQRPCSLFPTGQAEPALTDAQNTKPATLKALAVLKGYAHALAAVTSAADRTAFDASVVQLAGSTANLAKYADAAAPGASTIAPAVINAAGWLVGTKMDQDRFEALKSAVNKAALPIHTITGTLGLGLQTISDARRMVLYEETVALSKPLGPSMTDAIYKQQLTLAQNSLGLLDGLRQADAADTANSLAAAHDALVAAVNDPGRSYANLMKAVGEFSDKAAALQTALAAPQKPAKADAGSAH